MRRVITEDWCVERLLEKEGQNEYFGYGELVYRFCPSDVDLTDCGILSGNCEAGEEKCKECWLRARGSLKEED